MRHRKKSEKFSRPRAQRKALVNSLLRSLLIYERITTSESKAKAMRTWADKVINWSKTDTLANRRLSYRLLKDHSLVKRLFTEIGPRYQGINGGYTRVIGLKLRKGDGAKLSILELTQRVEKKKGPDAKIAKGKKAAGSEKEAKSPESLEKKKGLVSGMKKMFKAKGKDKDRV